MKLIYEGQIVLSLKFRALVLRLLLCRRANARTVSFRVIFLQWQFDPDQLAL